MVRNRQTPAQIMQDVKCAIREPYAWPGGYPKYILMSDGESLSVAAAKEQFREVCRATLQQDRSGWDAYGVDINWEDPALYCAHTGERIESAYAEDEVGNVDENNS
jgi:hypothetical protein